FWLGMVPADILYALGILNYGFFPDFSCVGGFGWGIADGLMITSLLLMSLAFIISHRKTDEEHHVESKEEEGQRTIIQSGKTRLMRGVFSSMTIPIALFFQFIINIFGVLWIEAAEINYPTGFHLAVLYSFPEVGFLWQALLLGLVISLLLELLEVALTPMFTLNTTAARLTKIAMMVFVSVPFILVRGAGFLTIFSLMLVLSTTFSYAMLVALAEQGLPAMAEDESETYEFERKISPIMTATLTLFATMFFLRMVPYILFTRFANAVILTLIAFLGFGVIVGFTRISGWVILRSFEDSLSARVVDGIKIIILLVIIAEVTWPFLPIFGFAPSAVLMTFGVHKVLSTRWPRRFGTEVIAISSKGAARIFIPNLKAVGLCLFLIITPTLIINESRAFWGPESEISNIRIAVIDDGINTESARFRQHVVAERSFVETIYGYDRDELDPLPSGFGTSHATMIALAILDVFPEASIINARVRSSDDEFRSDAFEAAIRWSINDADASVISLSFGRDEYDIEAGHYDEILSWARERNVFVVASAGNDNLADWAQGGLGTIGYPGASPYVLSAGALNTSGYVDSISSRGPLSNGVIKPDLVAPGYIFENDFLLGTSFAAPRVAAAAAVIIDSLETEGFNWTPGLIAAALVGSAIDLGLQPYVQGAGLFDIEGALDMILDAPRNEENIPILLSVHPNEVPLDFETVFTEVNTTERVTVFCSIPMNISIDIPSSLLGLVSADTVEINQSGTIDLIISAPSSSAGDRYEGTIQFSYGEVVDSANISFEVIHPTARLALDTSHDRRNWYTTYMLYSEYYRSLTEDGICVTELRTQDEFRQCNLSVFDALVVVNPYASWWGLEREFKEADRDKIASYFLEGGNVLFAIDEKTNATAMNLLFNWTGISATGISGRYSLLNATPHPIIEGFDYPLAEEYESRTNYQILNTTANFTSVIYHHQSAMLVCGVFPNRIAAFGASSWFQNKWFGASVKSDIILSMTYWILHLK
ncbi:MAG: S8 family serine peptidase, partial [Candidatus Thorarchaeota archaeon]